MRRISLIVLVLLALVDFSCGKTTEPKPEPETSISPHAVHLQSNSINSISATDGNGNITFTGQPADVASLSPGELIACEPIAAAPNGFLRRVESVSVVGTTTVVSTSQASLTDVFERAAITCKQTLTYADLSLSKTALPKGVSLRPGSGEGFIVEINDVVLYDHDGNPDTENDQIKLNGSLEISPSFVFSLSIDNYALKELRFVNTTVETADLEVSCGASISYEPKVRLATLNFTPITIWVGWVPVVICPVLGVDVGADVEATVGVKTEATQTATLEAGLVYKNSAWQPVSTFSKSFTFQPPQLTASVSVKGYVGPQLNLLIYGVAGPYANLHGYVELEADVFADPWWQLYGGAEVGVGVEVQILGKNITDYYVPSVVGYRDVIAQAPSGLSGTLAGVVRDAVTSTPLQGVAISVIKSGTTIAQGTTNASGEYSIAVSAGNGYGVLFSKTGYLPVTYADVAIAVLTETHLEPVMQIDNSHAGAGTIAGTIVDALSGSPVSGLALKLRSGMNTRTGTALQQTSTDDSGAYTFTSVPAGNYTIEASGTGYVTTYFTVLSIGNTTVSGQDATISPVLDPNEYRIILTWGENPHDLDSHLTGPTPDGTRFHTYYANKVYEYNGTVYAELDHDDVTSYGPETTTIHEELTGMYRYSVHDFSDRSSSYSYALSNSGAQVRVYKGSDLVQTFYVPSNTEGTLWTVFELFGSTISPKNTMSYESLPSNVTQGQMTTDAELIKNMKEK